MTYEEQILDRPAARLDRHRRLGRHRRRVRLRHEELRRRRDHRGVPRPDGADRGRRGLQGAAQALQEARREGAALDQGRVDRGHRRQGQGHRLARTARKRSSRPTRCSRRSASRRGSRATASSTTGVETTDRGAIEIDEHGRTNVDGVYAIGDVTGKLMLAHTAEAQGIVAAETIAGAETMPSRVRLDPAGDVLPAADRVVRLLRGAGQGEGVRRQGRQVPVLGQRQGHGPRRQPSASSRSSPTRSTTRSSAPT